MTGTKFSLLYFYVEGPAPHLGGGVGAWNPYNPSRNRGVCH